MFHLTNNHLEPYGVLKYRSHKLKNEIDYSHLISVTTTAISLNNQQSMSIIRRVYKTEYSIFN